MPIRRPLLSLALCAAVLAPAVLASAARAGWYPGDSVDGPSADIESLGDVDIAPDGTGAVVYLKREAGVPHVFASRMVDGAFRPPERVDVGLAGPAGAATVAAGSGRRLIVAFVSGGSLFGSFAAGGGRTEPLTAPQLLAQGSPDAPVADPHSDVGVNGTGYVVFASRGDVGAFRLDATTWERVGSVLDVDPAQRAGEGAGRPRIAVSADGNAVATWAETHPDGRRRVFGRRITGLAPSAAPQEVSLPDLGGAPAGAADSPDIDVEDDGSFAWVVWRQDFGGTSRTVARRLVGSLFEAPTAFDGGGPAGAPRFEMNGRGIGHAVASGPGSTVIGSFLDKRDTFGPAGRLDALGSAADPLPAVAVAERRQVGLVWRRQAGDGSPATVQARFKPDERPFEPETTLSVPGFGPVASAAVVSGDNNGDFAAAFLQGPPEARRLVAAVYDKPPVVPIPRSTSKYQRTSRPTLKWSPGTDLWGGQEYKVFVDDIEVGTARANELVVPTELADGQHAWRVQAVDRRGQTAVSKTRVVRVDTGAPVVRVKLRGARRAGQALRVVVSASDGEGSGVARVRVDYGDRTPASRARRSVHRYARAGTYRLRVRVGDRSGNVARRTVRLRIAG